jgi:hypothetical protein
MHLLERNNASKLNLITFNDNGDDVPLYGIVSHTRSDDEVLFKEMVDDTGEGSPLFHIGVSEPMAWMDKRESTR